jgi:hypothetical protein
MSAMRMTGIAAAIAAVLFFSTPAAADCVTLESAREYHALLPADIIQVEWRGDQARRFLTFLFKDPNEVLDLVFLFQFNDGTAQFTVGSQIAGKVCSSPSFRLDPDQVESALQAVYGQPS